MIDVDPASLTRVAAAWDDEQQDLLAAARQLAAAPVSGFTAAVAGPAARFAGAWQRHTTGLADAAAGSADRLRRVLADHLDTDAGRSVPLEALRGRTGQVAP